MRVIFLLRCTLVFLSMMAHQVCFAPNLAVTFSLELQDYDIINLNSSVTLQNKDYAAIDNQKALWQAGIKFAYKNHSSLFDFFVNFPLYYHCQKYNKQKPEKEETLITALNFGINYSLNSSELSIKFLPIYGASKNAYIKKMLLYNFVVRHYKRDAKGFWSFIGYETKDGYTSFEDYLQKSKKNMYNAYQINGKKLDKLDDKIKEAIALALVNFCNNELKDFWGNLFASMAKGLNRGMNR